MFWFVSPTVSTCSKGHLPPSTPALSVGWPAMFLLRVLHCLSLSRANAHLQVLPVLLLQHTLGIWAMAHFVPLMLSQWQLNTRPAAGLCFRQLTPPWPPVEYYTNMALLTSLPHVEVFRDVSFPPNEKTYLLAQHSQLPMPWCQTPPHPGCSMILRLGLIPELFRDLNKSLCPGPTSENYVSILGEENERGHH